MSATKPVPVVIGIVAVDAICLSPGPDSQPLLRFGGVCNNIVCGIGALDLSPIFISPRFSGDIGRGVAPHFEAHGVDWRPLDEYAALSLFIAQLDERGEVVDERFVDGGSVRALTAAAIRSIAPQWRDASVVVSCADLDLTTLSEIAALSKQSSVPFWLAATSREEAWKLPALEVAPQFVGLNIRELQEIAPVDENDTLAIAAAAADLVTTDGACLVTRGSRGAQLCLPETRTVIYQPVTPIQGHSTVAAGDLLFASMLSARSEGKSWEDALHESARRAASFIIRNVAQAANAYALLREHDSVVPAAEILRW